LKGLKKTQDQCETTQNAKREMQDTCGGMQNIIHLKRNQAALTAKRMKPDAITNIASKLAEIESLKSTQNELKNKTGRVLSSNIEAGNEIWDTLKLITDTGTALYKGVDSVKQKEYTLSTILKRISNSQKGSTDDATPKTDTPDY
jgi:hypothetical protein